MKYLGFLSVVFIMFLSTFAFAETPDNADESAIKETITSYIGGIDTRDSKAVDNSLYTDATVVTVSTISNKTNKFSANEVISRVKNGIVGGWKREVNFETIDANTKTAVAKVAVTDVKLKQISFITLVNDNGQWKIVSDVSTVSQNK